jgi:hypothetical protein
MNRHERRAAEAREHKRFEDYRNLYRKAYRKGTDRQIGEAWMRGAAAEDVKYMIVHPSDEPPPSPSDDDLFFSVAYGPQRFLARAAKRNLPSLVAQWPDFIRQLREQGDGEPLITDDARHDAREFIFSMVLDNHAQGDGTWGTLTASAVAWLVSTSPAGAALGAAHKVTHYEITDQAGPAVNGKRARNFRLALLNDLSELTELKNLPPPPQW